MEFSRQTFTVYYNTGVDSHSLLPVNFYSNSQNYTNLFQVIQFSENLACVFLTSVYLLIRFFPKFPEILQPCYIYLTNTRHIA